MHRLDLQQLTHSSDGLGGLQVTHRVDRRMLLAPLVVRVHPYGDAYVADVEDGGDHTEEEGLLLLPDVQHI